MFYYVCGFGLQNFNTCLSGVLFTPGLVSVTMNIQAILGFKSGERRINREKIFVKKVATAILQNLLRKIKQYDILTIYN